jgi:hypothetical protein
VETVLEDKNVAVRRDDVCRSEYLHREDIEDRSESEGSVRYVGCEGVAV